MICSSCGSALAANALFCVKCGTRVSPILSPEAVAYKQAQAPPLSEFSVPPPPSAYAVGKKLIVPQGAVLPDRCLKCTNPAVQPWPNKTFLWHPRWCYALLLPSPIAYVIAAAIARKQMKLDLPLCAEHKARRKKFLWIGGLLLALFLPVGMGMALIPTSNSDAVVYSAIAISMTMFLVGLVYFVRASPINPTRITTEYGEFAGASPDFLATLPPGPDCHSSNLPM